MREGTASLVCRAIKATVTNDRAFAETTGSELPLVNDESHEKRTEEGCCENTNCDPGLGSYRQAAFLGFQGIF